MRRHLAVWAMMGAFAGLPCLGQQPAEATGGAGQEAAAGPTRVTLNLEGVSAEEAMAELGKIGNIDFHSDNPQSWGSTDLVFLNVKDRPYWSTVLEVCRQAKINLEMYQYGSDKQQVRVFPGQNLQIGQAPTCEVGNSLLVLQSESRNYNLSFQSPEQVHTQVAINGVLMLDPKLRLTSSNVTPRISTAVDENGVSLALPDNNNVMYGGQQGGTFIQTYFNLGYPANAGRKLAKVAGTLRMSAVVKEEVWEIKDILNAKPQTHETAIGTITIKSVKPRGAGMDGYEMKLNIKAKSTGAAKGRRNQNDYQSTWGMVQRIELLTAEGTKFSFAGGGGGDDWQVYFNAPQNTKTPPTTLKWNVPLEIKEVEEPFEFKDLPIP